MPNTCFPYRIDTQNIVDDAITQDKIADNAVGSKQIINKCISAVDLGLNCVITEKIADNAITSSKIADNAITSSKIADNSVTQSKLADKSASGNKVKLDYISWHAPSIPITNVSFTDLRSGLYLVLACCEGLYSDSIQTHKLTITTSEGDYSVDSYAYDGGSNHLIVTLFNACQVGDGTIDISWDGYHIHHIYLIWLGLP